MSKHTPGPWHYESGAVWEHEGDSDTPDAVAIARRGDKSFQCYHRPGSESDANMRLISAAPDLLHACRNLVATLEAAWTEKELTAPRYVQCQLGTEVGHAKAAIVKAEGRGE